MTNSTGALRRHGEAASEHTGNDHLALMVIFDSCPNREISEFYAGRAAAEGWSRGVLQAKIASRLHERTQPALTDFDRAVPEADREAVREIV